MNATIRLYWKYKQYEPNEEWAEEIKRGPFVVGTRLWGFTHRNIRTIFAYCDPRSPTFGDMYASFKATRPAHYYRCIRKKTEEVLKTPQSQALINWYLANQRLPEKAITTLVGGMDANKFVGKGDKEAPDWNARLRAADMILKMIGAYDTSSKNDADANKDVIDVDFNAVHPEVVRYFALYKKWPKDEIKKRLEAGETVEAVVV